MSHFPDSDDAETFPSNSDPENCQFSLMEMLVLMAIMAIILGGTRLIARFLPGGETVENQAGIMGLASLACMIFLSFVPFSRRIVLIGWWTLLGLYILTAIVALVQHK